MSPVLTGQRSTRPAIDPAADALSDALHATVRAMRAVGIEPPGLAGVVLTALRFPHRRLLAVLARELEAGARRIAEALDERGE